ncbi:MAG: preprotein translocase subunit SecE [Phycisphaerales bacterium]|jgi:preprotein translocase SecE subunit|nr:preprotein translocase subunit SecE [Phycisphaerales bacterium]
MSVGIYKQGQGYWVRLMSSIGFGLLIMMGVVWLWDQLAGVQIGTLESVYVQGGVSVLVVAICGIIGYYLIGRKPKLVDFMIATEGEMRKVNWSTRREIVGSTILVILLTLFIAIFCQIADLVFSAFFQWGGVLQST